MQGRQQCPTIPAAVVPASGLASAVVYCAQRRQRKRGQAGQVIAGAESYMYRRARVRDRSCTHGRDS